MGDLQTWLPHQIGFLADYNPPPAAAAAAHSVNPLPSEIGEESWRLAERATAGVIENIRATLVSERKRQEVVDYVQKLIRYRLNCEVYLRSKDRQIVWCDLTLWWRFPTRLIERSTWHHRRMRDLSKLGWTSGLTE